MTRSIAEAATGSRASPVASIPSPRRVQATTGDTDQARQAAGELADMGTELRRLVGRFTYAAGG